MEKSMQMSVSPIIKKKGKMMVYVQFLDGKKKAEGRIPDCKMISSEGFSEKEIAALELYLKSEQGNIMEMAKEVNVMNAFLGR